MKKKGNSQEKDSSEEKGRGRSRRRRTTEDPDKMSTAYTMDTTDDVTAETTTIKSVTTPMKSVTTSMRSVSTPLISRTRPTPTASPLRTGLVSLAAVCGVIFFIIIVLILILCWRKRRRGTGNHTADKNDTYHMYSDIDPTTIIFNEEHDDQNRDPKEATVSPSAPPLPENEYDKLHSHEKTISQASENEYSKLDPKMIDLKDPRLSEYDISSPYVRSNCEQNGENEERIINGITNPHPLPDNYFLVEKEDENLSHEDETIPNNSSEVTKSDDANNYFVVESDETIKKDNEYEEVKPGNPEDTYYEIELE